MSTADSLIAANREYAATFAAPAKTPARALAVVACMDARLDPYAALGLRLGDAHVIRNAGGLPTDDVLRSLALSQRALGTREVVLVHHTDCGMQGLDDERFRLEIAAETGTEPTWSAPPFESPHTTMQQSLTRVRQCPWLPHRDLVRGFVFDVTTGLLEEIP
jgi:carbonic anhydrase